MDRDGREWNYQALLNLVVLLDKSVHRGGVLRLRLLVQRAKDLLRDGVHAVAWVRVDVLGRGLVAHLAGGRVGHVVRVAHQRVGAVDLGVDAVEVAKQVVKAAVLRRGQGRVVKSKQRKRRRGEAHLLHQDHKVLDGVSQRGRRGRGQRQQHARRHEQAAAHLLRGRKK